MSGDAWEDGPSEYATLCGCGSTSIGPLESSGSGAIVGFGHPLVCKQCGKLWDGCVRTLVKPTPETSISTISTDWQRR